MQNIFIVNPVAGQCLGDDSFVRKIENICTDAGCEYKIYVTKGILDGRDYVRRLCLEYADKDMLRFFACGGDGTLSEVVNGSYGFRNVEIGCIPIGTGNDFIRIFDRLDFFSDIKSQLCGKSIGVDLIKYTSKVFEYKTIGYAVNMFNIGFDCNVVDITSKLKKKPFLSGSMAYMMGVLIILIEKKGANLKIEWCDEVLWDGKMLLTSIANGCFCGGGVKGSPLADVTDGLMDVSIIKNISRVKFLSLFPKYSKGKHLDVKGIEQYIDYSQRRVLRIRANGKPMRLCVDGEIMASEIVEFETIPKSMQFIIPNGVKL